MEKIGRKIYHVLGGLILVAAYVKLGRGTGLVAILLLLVSATAIDYSRVKIPSFNAFFYSHFSRFIRESERNKLTGTPPYLLGILLTLAIYDVPVAAYAVAFLACGDVSATTVGERYGTIKISGCKSLQGTVAFVAAAVLAGMLINSLLYPISLPVILAGALCAAVVEILPLRIDDNLTIPVVSGGLMSLLLKAGL